jgi:oxygen-independent coproporphyrinogen-3 oxidase
MTAFPGITLDSFKKSLREAIRLQPEHISCYTLIFEPGTLFYNKMLKGQLNPLEDDEEASYYKLASAILKESGYNHYEISNFSLGEDNLCKHNLIYWNHKPYLGLGPSAHSFFDNQRYANKRSLSFYIDALGKGNLPIDFQENLSNDDLIFEYMLLNLRLQKGINLSDFRTRFGVDCYEKFDTKIKYLSENNLIEMDDRYLRLSERGWMFADSIAAYF